MTTTTGKWVTVAEAARIAGMGWNRMNKLARGHKLTIRHMPNRHAIKINRASLMAWMESQGKA